MTEITELEELAAEKVAGVGAPANGTPFLLLKAAAPCATCHGTGKIRDGHMDCPDCTTAKSDSPESDQIEEEVTDEAAKAKLKAKDRKKLADSDFALPEKREYPIPDENHARAALSMLHNATPAEQRKIRAAVRRRYPQIEQSKKSSPGVPAYATQTPVEGGHFDSPGSGGRGTMTTGVKHPHEDPSYALGGQTPYVIPAEAKAYAPDPNPPAPGRQNRPEGMEAAPGVKATATVITSLMEAIDLLGAQRKLEKKGKVLQVPNPTAAESSDIGSGPWENYDSVSLEQVAQMLASCGHALDAIRQREAVEAAAGNEGDVQDTQDLDMAGDALDAALGVVARLAFHEGAAADALAKKSGRVLSRKNEEHLRAARDHLSHVLAGVANQPESGEPDSEENQIMTTVTKEELETMVSTSAQKAVEAARKAEKKAAIKAAKKAAKREKKARKNANNGGDISGEQERAGVRGDIDDELNGVPDGNKVDPQYINKSDQKAMKSLVSQLKAANEGIASLQEKVGKMARRPVAGGPVLDGIPRGAFPASENRLGQATKAADELEALEKALEAEMAKTGPEAAQRASDLGAKLTLARLRKHALGEL
jgi:hypothetical protein